MHEETKRHGHIRGWVKTGNDGKYTIYTIRPAPYPNDALPAHIHLAIKEPDIANEYYVDELNFDDDRLLIPHSKKYPFDNRGGSGVLRVLLQDDLQIAEHDIVLGLNIPNYPKEAPDKKQFGLSVGEDQPSFMPLHAYGPDKGTKTCPVCKYGRYHGILYFVGENANWNEIKQWLTFLEQQSADRNKYLKAYFVYGNKNGYNKSTRQNELEKIGAELKLQHVALTFVPSFTDTESEAHLNKINPTLENTFVVYKHRSIISKFYELKPTTDNFKLIAATLDKTKNEYFNLPEIAYDDH
jgi:protocatechuate 3,4-dioxygenase, beta subunit